METTIDKTIKGIARPNRKVRIKCEPCWITIVEIDGTFMEWALYDADTLLAHDNSSMELLEPVHARELYISVTGDETVNYTLTITKSKEL
jgi:hypothetical protein